MAVTDEITIVWNVKFMCQYFYKHLNWQYDTLRAAGSKCFECLKCTTPMASALSTYCPKSFYEYLFNLVREILLVFTV